MTLAAITDGTSNTAMWSEWLKGSGMLRGRQAVYPSTLTYSPTTPSPANLGSIQASLMAVAASCQPSPTTSALWDNKGASWAVGMPGVGGGYSHLLAPNKYACFFSNGGVGAYSTMFPGLVNATMIGAQSYHSGGVNVGFIDGSVHFVKDSTALQIWGAIATMRGGEVVSSNSY